MARRGVCFRLGDFTLPQVFSRKTDQIVYFVLYGALVIVIVGPSIWLIISHSSYATGQFTPYEQPVPFSHKHHVGDVGLDCRYCHQGVETSNSAGLPATEICMTCHSQIFANADVLGPVRQSFASRTPLEWTRVNSVPDFVFFNHAVHVNNGVGCVTCHGRVDQMPITWQAAPLTMQWCLNCHRDPGPNLRPRNQIYSMTWRPQGDRKKLAESLLAHYRIHTDTMTDC